MCLCYSPVCQTRREAGSGPVVTVGEMVCVVVGFMARSLLAQMHGDPVPPYRMESGRADSAYRRDHGPKLGAKNHDLGRAAGAPSLRQYKLDQVHRVTALRRPAPSVSQPLVGTPQVNAQTLRTANRFVNRVGGK